MHRRINSWLLGLFPLASSYIIPFSGIDFGTFLLLISFVVVEIKQKKVELKLDFIACFLYYILISTIINIFIFSPNNSLSYPSETLVILRMLKFLLVLFIVFVTNYLQYFKWDYFIDATRFLIYINSGFVILQQSSFYLLGVTISNPLAVFAVNELYNSDNYVMTVASILRPSGFFLEPAHLAQCFLLYLCFLLFSKNNMFVNIKDYIVLLLGILCSSSGMGVLFITLLTFIALIKSYKSSFLNNTVLIILFVLAAYILHSTTFVQVVFDRVFSEGTAYGGNAIQARIGNGYEIFSNLTLFNKLIGCGFGNVPIGEYFNGIAYLLNTLGIIGFVFFLIVLLGLFKRFPIWGRWALLCYFLLLIGAQVFTSATIVYYFSTISIFILDDNNDRQYG